MGDYHKGQIMENLEKLIQLIYRKHIEDSPTYEYDYNTLDIIRASIAKIKFQQENPNGWFDDHRFEQYFDVKKSLNELVESGYIGFAVRTGGNSGGNCWGGDSSYEPEDNINFDNEYLDKVLEIVAPEVTYLTYRKIEKTLIEKTEYVKREYYGNDDRYHVELIFVKDLIEVLRDKKSLIDSDKVEQLMNDYQSQDNTKKVKP